MWELAIRLNLRHIRKQWLRTVLAFVGIVMSVVTFVFAPSLADTIRTTISQTSDDLAGNASLEVRAESGGINETVLSQVRQENGVVVAAPMVLAGGLYTQQRTLMAFIGVDFAVDEQIRDYRLLAGETLRGESQVLLPADFASEMGLELGDELTLLGLGATRTLRLVGLLSNESGLARINSGDMAVMSLEDAFALKGNRELDSIAILTGEDSAQLMPRLQASLGDTVIVDTPLGRFQQSQDFSNFTTFLLAMVSFVLSCFGAVLIYNSVGIGIAQRRSEIGILRAIGMESSSIQIMYIIESGIIGILGSTLGVILGLGMVGMAQGMPVLPADFNGMGFIASEAPVIVPLWLLPMAFGLGVSFSLLAAYFSTRQIAQVEPAEALIQIKAETGMIDPAGWRIPLGIACILLILMIPYVIAPSKIFSSAVMIMIANMGVLLCMAALILLYSPVVRLLQDKLPYWLEAVFGVEGMLAASNFIRRPKRMLTTGIFLACAVTMGVYIGQSVFGYSDFIDSWNASQNVGDIVVTSAGEDPLSPLLPLPDDVVSNILEAPEIVASYGLRQITMTQDGAQYILRAMDMQDFYDAGASFIFDMGDAETATVAIQDETQNVVYMSTGSSTILAGYAVGSILQLDTPAGQVDFTVLGIVFGGISPQQSVIFMNRQVYARYWGDSQLDSLTLVLAADADANANAMRRDILSRYALRGVLAFDAAEMRQAFVGRTVESIQTVSTLMTGLLIMILVVGIGSTFYILILDRRREIGMLRAAGMQSKQIARSVLLEMIVLFVIGAVLGVPIAILAQACQDIFTRGMMGLSLAVNPSQISIMIIFVFVLTMVAAFIPARVASNTNVLEAMHYE